MALNVITAIGRLTRDPERRTVNDRSVVSFTLAAPTRYKDKSSDDPKAVITNFWHVSVWEKLDGDHVMDWAKQGDELAVSGDVTIRKYKTKDGADAYSFDIDSRSVTFLRKKGENVASAAATNSAPATATTVSTVQSSTASHTEEDDLPF